MSASTSTRGLQPAFKPAPSLQAPQLSSRTQLPIGGLIPFSASDWPDHLTMTLFLNGCPLRCSYCHNPQLQAFGPGSYTWQEALSLLCSRRGLLDGVVFSGGEPLSAPGLPQAIASAHAAGFKVGLHTSGYLPSRLDKLMAHPETRPEWIGIDVKALPEDLPQVTGCSRAQAQRMWESFYLLADYVRAGRLSLQARTTLWPGSCIEARLPELEERVAQQGLKLVPQWAHDVDKRGVYCGAEAKLDTQLADATATPT